MAVVQAINKQREGGSNGYSDEIDAEERVFDHDDEQLLQGIVAQAGIALTNARLYDIEKAANEQSTSLVETSSRLSPDST